MIEWLARRQPSSTYLVTSDRVWTYGDAVAEVESRLAPDPLMIRPTLAPDSVFDLLAGMAGGGAVVVPGTGQTTPASPRPPLDASAGRRFPGERGDETRLVVYTSGTTGRPRGVRLTLRNIEAASRASMLHLGHGPGDTWLLAMPLHHVGGLSILVRSAYAGGSVFLTPGFDPTTATAAMQGKVSMVSMVSTMLSRALDHDPGPYQGLRAVIIGGGPIPDGLLERAWAAGLPALPSYGMTETFGQVATLLPDAGPRHCAHPLPGIDLRIEPDGRIAVAGEQVSPGYLGEPDREGRWLVTNDLGVIDPDGALRVLGRADTVIVTGGENVDPARVETELSGHPGAGEVVVVGVPDPDWGTVVACLYTGDAEEATLAAWVKERLPGHMVPKRWQRVDRIPMTPLGKPDRVGAAALCAGGA
jgi:o-succinylbenzoate---CoA ligase